MIGFNSDVPTIFVSPSSGSGTTGQVGIGVSDIPSGYKMAVKGKIICEEVVVKHFVDWPDFVFDSKYKLMTFEERQKFYEKYHHLPHIVSAFDINENGIEITKTLIGVTQNLEEHELYLMQLHDEMRENKKLIEEQHALILEQKKLIQEQREIIDQLKETSNH